MRNVLSIGVMAVLAIAASASASAVCLVNNGDFSVDLIGWTYGSAGVGTPQFNSPAGLPSTGPTAGLFSPGPSPDGDPVMLKSITSTFPISGSNWIYQEIFPEVGTTYNVDGHYAGGVGALIPGGGSASWEVVLYPGSYDAARTAGTADTIASTVISSDTGGQFGWTPINYSFTATTTTYTLALKWGVSSPNANVTTMSAYFDGLCVAPEPATMVLFALALPLLRRRRAA